jgi:hypothetical protein
MNLSGLKELGSSQYLAVESGVIIGVAPSDCKTTIKVMEYNDIRLRCIAVTLILRLLPCRTGTEMASPLLFLVWRTTGSALIFGSIGACARVVSLMFERGFISEETHHGKQPKTFIENRSRIRKKIKILVGLSNKRLYSRRNFVVEDTYKWDRWIGKVGFDMVVELFLDILVQS